MLVEHLPRNQRDSPILHVSQPQNSIECRPDGRLRWRDPPVLTGRMTALSPGLDNRVALQMQRVEDK